MSGCFWAQVCVFWVEVSDPLAAPLTPLGCKTNGLADEENRLWSKSGENVEKSAGRGIGGSVRGQLER